MAHFETRHNNGNGREPLPQPAGRGFAVPASHHTPLNESLPNAAIGAGASEMRARLDQFLEGLEPYSSIEVYVAPGDRLGRPIDFKRFLREVEKCLLAVTSGTNRNGTESTWKGRGGRVLREQTAVVKSFVPLASIDRLLQEVLPNLLKLAHWANQEELLVVLDGYPIFLRPTEGASQ